MTSVDYELLKQALVDSGLRESSAGLYESRIKKVLTGVFDDKNPKISKLKKNPKKLIEYVEQSGEFPSANTKKVALMAITHLYQIYDLPITAFENSVKHYTELADAESLTNTKEEDIEKITNIDFDEMKKRVPDIRDPTDRLILAFYSYLPPLRQQDLIDLPVMMTRIQDKKGRPAKDKQNAKNHVNLKQNKLHIHDHKTSRIHGSKVINIPMKLADEIRHYMKRMDSKKLLPLSSSAFSRRLKKLVGVSSSGLRKAYVSKYAPKMSAEELVELSKIMGHKISTQMLSYRKPISATNATPELKPDEPAPDSDEE